MVHTARSLSSFILWGLLLLATSFLLSCSLFDKRPSAHTQMAQITKQKVFFASYDSVWRAAHSVIKYPIAAENQDTGIIETEFIKGLDGWIAPDQEKAPSTGIRYKLILTFAKGTAEGRESTRVTIDKKIQILRDFFSEPELVDSDGLEEKIIFYRIERELVISEALKRVD